MAFNLPNFCLVSFKLLAFLLLNPATLIFAEAANLGNDTDKLALLDLKSHLTDYPDDVFSSWNDSVSFCQWKGVECSSRHHNHNRVTGLHLKWMNLYGSLSPSIGNLSFLHALDLSGNSFTGVIPPELGRLKKLQDLNLSFNSFTGVIPANLSGCPNLISISLSHNSLKQEIPWELGALLKLERLHLYNNKLTGKFPASFGNLSSVQEIVISFNDMKGEIPETVGGLKNLKSLLLGINHFSGIFPPAVYNLSSLERLALPLNNFHGNLRRDMGIIFPNIERLLMSSNSFTGQIPVSLSNASNLSVLDLSCNHLTGNIPASLANLQNLIFLNFHNNSLGNHADDDLPFLDSLANCSILQMLDISINQFGGKLTSSIANLSSHLNWLSVRSNSISESIPDEIAGLVGLTTLLLDNNLFTSKIPTSIGTLPRLQRLHLNNNRLTGELPPSLGNLTQLLQLSVFRNGLEGSLPPIFSNLKLLQDAKFCHNKLNGTIPPELFSLPSLTLTLNLSHNSFTGPFPAEVGNLIFLTQLDVSYNHLSGVIPLDLGRCLSLNTLYMQNNLFEGSIPDLSQLKGLQYLDLSRNNLSGEIPDYLVKFPLLNLNLSWNYFEGNVPTRGVFKNETAIQIYGNNDLCGGMPQLKLQPCPVKTRGRPRHVNLKLILPVVIVSSCLLLLFFVLFLHRKNLSRGKVSSESSSGWTVHPYVTFKELYDSTEKFSSKNLIGAGSFGAVYRGILEQGKLPAAVKVLNLHQKGASKSFVAECQALKNIRHRNLVRVLTVCSGTDYEGHDFKALVYPYMSNGSLENWLYPEDELSHDRNLNLTQRLNIAMDIASALQYLHHECQFPVIHSDLKPSNVLLDSDLTAHVSDFGLARLVSKFRGGEILNQFSSLGIKGTIGYIAPEYGTGSPVSTLGDVYSYGILLLEMFTGRRPVDEIFEDNYNLHNFVKQALSNEAVEIVDQSILRGGKGASPRRGLNKGMTMDCLVSVLEVGIACSAANPEDRIQMGQVVQRLVSAKEKQTRLVYASEDTLSWPESRKREQNEDKECQQ